MDDAAEQASPGIGTLAEKSLHASLKEWIAEPGDRFEVKTGRFVIDIVRDDTLIEIQTRHLYAMKRKLSRLLPDYTIHLYHPIPQARWIVRESADGEFIGRRKSPKKGQILDIFAELVRVPHLLLEPNLTLHVLLTHEESVLRDDGKGSWRRKGWSSHDRRLLSVVDEATFFSGADYLALLPEQLERPFTNKSLSKALGVRTAIAQKMTYTLRAMGLIEQVGKQGRSNLFEVVS